MSDLVKEFHKWIKSNYPAKIMTTPPEDWDEDKELYYEIDDMYYGPVRLKDIPKQFVEETK